MAARYDGLADWYDAQFPSAFGDAVAVHVPLDDLLNAVAAAGLCLERVLERFGDPAPPAILALRGRRER